MSKYCVLTPTTLSCREFKNEMARLQSQHQQQLNSMNTSLDRLAAQLHASQLKLETLQTSAFRSRDEKQNVDQSWATRYEKLRVEAEAERRALEGEVRRLEDHIRTSDSALDRAKSELETSARERDVSASHRVLHLVNSTDDLLCVFRAHEMSGNAITTN